MQEIVALTQQQKYHQILYRISNGGLPSIQNLIEFGEIHRDNHMKTRKKKKKTFIQTELLGLFRVKWKLTHGQPLDWDGKKKEGETNFPALTQNEVKDKFLSTYNIAGRKFKVLSVTEIQKGKVIHNQEHEDYDKIPV